MRPFSLTSQFCCLSNNSASKLKGSSRPVHRLTFLDRDHISKNFIQLTYMLHVLSLIHTLMNLGPGDPEFCDLIFSGHDGHPNVDAYDPPLQKEGTVFVYALVISSASNDISTGKPQARVSTHLCHSWVEAMCTASRTEYTPKGNKDPYFGIWRRPAHLSLALDIVRISLSWEKRTSGMGHRSSIPLVTLTFFRPRHNPPSESSAYSPLSSQGSQFSKYGVWLFRRGQWCFRCTCLISCRGCLPTPNLPYLQRPSPVFIETHSWLRMTCLSGCSKRSRQRCPLKQQKGKLLLSRVSSSNYISKHRRITQKTAAHGGAKIPFSRHALNLYDRILTIGAGMTIYNVNAFTILNVSCIV